jgi:hypothetical protein
MCLETGKMPNVVHIRVLEQKTPFITFIIFLFALLMWMEAIDTGSPDILWLSKKTSVALLGLLGASCAALPQAAGPHDVFNTASSMSWRMPTVSAAPHPPTPLLRWSLDF